MSKLLEKMNTDKKEMTLGDVVTFHRGYDLPLTEIKKGTYPVVFSNGRKEYHNEFKVKAPGVFTGRSGSLGGMFYVEEDYWPHNTTLYVSDFHNNDPKYCYYFLSSFDFSKYNAGTGVPTLNRNHIHGIPVKIPSLPTQKKIAEILSAYDSKIENNNKIIKNLEATAQTIFNEWFINFRFPGHEKTKMVKSEMGDIPEGWEVFKLRDLFTFIKGKKPAEVSETQKEGFLQQILIDSFENGKKLYADKQGMVVASDEDLLMVMDGASSGRIEFGITGIVGSTMSKLQLHRPIRSILYFYLKSKEKDIKDNTSGSAIPHTDKEKVYGYELTLPKNTENFERTLLSFIKGVEKLNHENISLKSQRDQLLAKLI